MPPDLALQSDTGLNGQLECAGKATQSHGGPCREVARAEASLQKPGVATIREGAQAQVRGNRGSVSTMLRQ